MSKRRRRPEQGKIAKTKHLSRNTILKKHIPETRIFNRINFATLLQKYNTVYVKPDKGNHGIGVYKVTRIKKGYYHYQIGTRKRSFSSFDTMFKTIELRRNQKLYIVQRGIPCLLYRGRPFDVRVMIQRNVNTRRWHVNGMVGRIAGPGRIISNYYAGKTGGTVKKVGTILGKHMTPHQIILKKNALMKQAYNVAVHMQKKFPNLNEIGLDVVYDKKFKPWFLEVNTRYPSKRLFRLMGNMIIYRRIKRFSDEIKQIENKRL